jgi:hypothetical protein
LREVTLTAFKQARLNSEFPHHLSLLRSPKRYRIAQCGQTLWRGAGRQRFVEAPWGGMKHSGIGRELGQWGLHNYLEVKQVTEYVSEQPWGWYLK